MTPEETLSEHLFEDLYKPHKADITLLKALGVDTAAYENARLPREEFFLGTVVKHGYTVDIFVTSCPACFYTARITNTEGKRFQVSTGSGTLERYWPVFEQIAEGMVEVENIS